ncbi:MAG: histidine phosphatase family protein [Cryobacterium sp.]|nr:histidine phosphatase family protein [Oligoflexia bacterium]
MLKTNSHAPILIYAFRHGQTDWNSEGRIQGHLDIPLNAVGKDEARRLAHGFRHLRCTQIVSSDLSRAMDTAKIALDEAHLQGWHPLLSLRADPRLREINLGRLQGLTHVEIHEQFGKELSGRLGVNILSDEELRDLGSESADVLLERVTSSLFDVVHSREFSDSPGPIAVSTHGGILRRLLHEFGGMTEIRFSIPNGVFFPFEFIPAEKKLRLLTSIPFNAG